MNEEKNNSEELVDAILALEELDYRSPIESFSQYAARRKAILLNQLKEEAALFNTGYKYILDDLQKQKEIVLEEYTFSEERLSVLNNEEKIQQAREEKKSYQEILEISNDQMFAMYEAAARYFEKEQYKESIAAFTFLTEMNDSVHVFWIGLGSSYRAIKDLDSALGAYYEGIMTDVTAIEPYKYAASCYLEMQDIESAKELFRAAVNLVETSDDRDNSEMQAFKEQAQEYLQALENEGF